MNFFKTKPRSPAELVRGLKDALNRVDAGPPGGEIRRRVSSYYFSVLLVEGGLRKERWSREMSV